MKVKSNTQIKNIFLILTALIAFFVLLESILFLSGKCLLYSRRANTKHQKDYIGIVCVGDSHTFGVGTSKQYSYPMQLETLLNYNNLQKFKVINLGTPGASTKHQAKDLEAFFKNKTAKVVVWLTGRNNSLEIQDWETMTLPEKGISSIKHLRSSRFLREIFRRIVTLNKEKGDIEYSQNQIRKDYLDYYLGKTKDLCRVYGAKLVLLSYYNSSSELVKNFAHINAIPYFDFTRDFQSLFKAREKTRYVSPDMSHMNYRGYKYFAERLYENLFLNQKYINIKISPLFKKIELISFYKKEEDVEKNIESQKNRIEQYRDSWEYPYELIHLGHIYMEVNKKELARQVYMKALISSNYTDNNTIVAPIINWHLENNRKEDAFNICEEILLYNPENSIAKFYYDWIVSNSLHNLSTSSEKQ